MPKKIFFGQLEQAIMNVAWRRGPVTVRDVLESLHRTIAYTTVMTVMNRLVQQQCLKRQMADDGAYRYRATTTQLAYHAIAAKQRAQELVRHYGDAALVQFMDTLDHVPGQKLNRLRRQFKRRQK